MPSLGQFPPIEVVTSVAIANGQTVSDAVDLGGLRPIALVTPAALTGTSFTFQSSVDGTTFVPVYDSSGSQVSVTVSTSRFVVLSPTSFAGVRHLKVVSGSAEGAARTIQIVARAI